MALSPLLPMRHPQGDFFVADIFDSLPFKSDQASMEHPLFTLQTRKPDMRTLTYTNGPETLEMMPSALGLPTIMDKDILLYCASVVMHHINENQKAGIDAAPPQTIRFSLRDALLTTNRTTSKLGYDSLKKALVRLTGAMVKTTIKTGRTEQGAGFHLVERYEYLQSTSVKDRQIGVELTLSDWFYNALLGKEVLTIDREYFQLRKSLDRRLYEIGRKHCGRAGVPWTIALNNLLTKSGSLVTLVKFRFLIRQIAETNHLPEYKLSFDSKTDIVTFKEKAAKGRRKGKNAVLPKAAQVLGILSPGLLDNCIAQIGPHYDFHGLWEEFKQWEGSAQATSVRGAFIGFCRKKVQADMESRRSIPTPTAKEKPAEAPPVLGKLPLKLLEECRKKVGTHYDYQTFWESYKATASPQTAQEIYGGFISFCRLQLALSLAEQRVEEQPDLFDDLIS